MVMTTYPKASLFLAKTQAHLLAKEAANSLILGICLRLDRFPERVETPPYLATVENEGQLILAAVMTPPHPLVIASDQTDLGQASQLILQSLLAGHWPLPGLLGPLEVAKQFVMTWAELSGGRYEINQQERLHKLRTVTPPPPTSGQLRVAVIDDLECLVEWTLAFQKEALGQEGGPETGQTVVQKIKDGDIYIWEDEGPVCMAAKTRPTFNGIAVGPVYTSPEQRGRGYATACVASLSQLLLEAGWQFCTLFTDLANPTANNIYQRIGYEPVCDFTAYRFIRP